MKIKVVGAGWFGCHIALSLIAKGHNVELHEITNEVFAGASGKIPARLHLGAFHYPRSAATQQACLEHQAAFHEHYGFLTRGVPVNIYAIANNESYIDFGTYKKVLQGQLEFLTVFDPAEFGLKNVEGAVMTNERHVVINKAKQYFEKQLKDVIKFNAADQFSTDNFDYVIDCTFCSNDEIMIDRFEPCLVLLLEGPADKAITIMDGPFPSLYPWDEDHNLLSLSSAKFGPITKQCKTWKQARSVLDNFSASDAVILGNKMVDSMAYFYPQIYQYKVVDHMTSIRAMPLSAADTRLVHVVKLSDKLIRIRAGKIDAVFDAERAIEEMIGCIQ